MLPAESASLFLLKMTLTDVSYVIEGGAGGRALVVVEEKHPDVLKDASLTVATHQNRHSLFRGTAVQTEI